MTSLSSNLAERKIVLELTDLLQKNADKVLSGEFKLCLTTSSVGIIATSFRRFSENANEYPTVGSKKLSVQQQQTELQRWRDHVKALYDFVLKVKALKVLHGTNTMRSPVMIARFQSVQVLEIKRLPIHMVEGLSKLRGSLIELRVSKSLESLEDLLEICGGDRSPGLVWPQLKSLYLSCNSLKQLDASLRFIPFVEVLDLSHNNFSETLDFLKCLAELARVNLGFNMLTSVPSFSAVSRLRTVVLRNNQLDNLQGLEKLTSLEELDVADNLLIEHGQLEPTAGLIRLMVLCVNGNPLCYKMNHRLLTVQQISPLAGVGVFLLDGQRLSQEELAVLRQNRARVVQQEFPAGSRDEVDHPIAESQLLPNPHASKKKHGHRRKPSRERIPKIANIEDSLLDEHLSSSCMTPAMTPGSSYKDQTDVAMEIETMRQHLKDDWLKALNVEQKDTVSPIETKDSNSAKDGKSIAQSGAAVEESKTKPSQIQVDVEKTPKSISTKDTKSEESTPVLPKEVATSTMKVTPASPTSPEFNIKVTTDIYAVSVEETPKAVQQTTPPDGGSVQHLYSQTSVRSSVSDTSKEGVQSVDYGDESDPFIVMLPGDDMKTVILTLNKRFLMEKDLNNRLISCLDLKCLLNVIQTEEECQGTNIMGGLQFYVLRLKFDYVRKDLRERAYALEDKREAWDLLRLLSKHLKSDKRTHVLMECLKCLQEFQQPQVADEGSGVIYKCPSCKSTMVIRSDKQPASPGSSPGNQENIPNSRSQGLERNLLTPDRVTNDKTSSRFSRKRSPLRSLSPHGDTSPRRGSSPHTGRSPQRDLSPKRDWSPRRRSSPGRGQSPQRPRSPSRGITPPKLGTSLKDRVDHLINYKSCQGSSSQDTRQSTVIEQAVTMTTEVHTSWSDDPTSTSTKYCHQSSVSSVESDIAILSKLSSHGNLTESTSETINAHEHSVPNENFASENDHVQLRKGTSNRRLADNGHETIINGIWKRDEQGHITPVGSPLSNIVCSSMVSSVYENTLAGAGDDGPSVHVHETTDTEDDTIILRKSRRLAGSPSPSRRNRRAVVYDSDNDSDVQRREKSVENLEIKVSNREYSIYDTDDSHNSSVPSVYDTARSQPDSERNSSNLSVYSDNNPSSSFSSPLRSNRSHTRSPDQRTSMQSADGNEQASGNLVLDFPSDLSPIKRRVKKRDHRSAYIYDDESNSSEIEKSTDANGDVSLNQSQSQTGSANTTGSAQLPWENHENKSNASGKDESLNHQEFVNIDHRVQLYLELKVFKGEESARCAIQCDIVQYMKEEPIKSILVISTHRILLFEITGESTSSDDWLNCYEDQPITELCYIDIGLGYQTLRLEFGTECASYSLLIADESRCKQFLTLISDIMQMAAMADHSKLEGIKSNPTTLSNLTIQVIHATGEEPDPEAEPQTLVRYLMVRLANEEEKIDQLLGLVITTTDMVLVEENHQWPLPRLQAPLSDNIKGKQFTIKHREKINNIESLMFNEYNPCELRLTFFESSDASSVKAVWLVTLETVKGVKSLVDAIKEPWEQEFGVSLDITSTSFSETG